MSVEDLDGHGWSQMLGFGLIEQPQWEKSVVSSAEK